MNKENAKDIVDEICKFGCNNCCNKPDDEKCVKIIDDYVNRLQKVIVENTLNKILKNFKGVDYYEYLYDGLQSMADEYNISI